MSELYEARIIEVLDKMRSAGLKEEARYLTEVFTRILPRVAAFHFHLARDKVTGTEYLALAEKVAGWNCHKE